MTRRQLRDFMQHKCGLVNPGAACRCAKQVAPSMAVGKLNPQRLAFATHPTITISEAREEIVEMRTMAGVFRSHPAYQAPDAFVKAIKQVLQSGQLSVLR